MPNSKLVNNLSPEEEELQRKKEEIAALERQLAELELDLSSNQADVNNFIDSTNAALGAKLVEEALLKSRLAEALLVLDRNNEEYERLAETARENVEDAQREYGAFTGNPDSSSTLDDSEMVRKIRASDKIRALYRKLVKLTLPDLTRTTDIEEKERRREFMQMINAAYSGGDQQRLEELLKTWDTSPESMEGEDIGADLVRVIRQISQVSQRIADVRVELSEFESTDDYEMFLQAKEQGSDNYLNELVASIDTEIDRLKEDIGEISDRIKEILDPSFIRKES
jgi:peptidoglycan hydrolase CwlO-like protein